MKHKKKELHPSWKHHAGRDMIVWQIMFTGSGTLVAQKRNTAGRQASFFSLDPENGRLLMDEYQPFYSHETGPAGEGWFTGLESTSEKLAYCHAYQQHSPEHLGIWAFDPAGGSVVWMRHDVVFSANLGAELLVYRPSVFAGFPERYFMLLDAMTGETLRELGEENPETGELRKQALPEEDRQQLLLPALAASSGFPPELDGLSLSETALREYIAAGTASVAALHEQGGRDGGWKSSILVYRDGLVY
ncbi:MAG: DUF4905 domain-containing protein, partial [Chlorobiaceae bacterium]|nr:DUF4905 domain-containing protein [Chlorobiaceae bacterium]